MRKLHFDRSPVVLALATLGGFVAGGCFFAMIVMDSMFRGTYLKVLPFAAFVFVFVFLTGWACLSVSAKDLRRIRETGRVAKVFGAAQAATIIQVFGVEQALVFARLVKSGRWTFNANLLRGQSSTSALSGKGVTDEDLADLAELRTVTWLDIAGSPVTDAGVGRLTHLSVLAGLILSGTKVTDNCLSDLRELPGLKKLDVDETRVTDAALRSTGLLDKKFSLREFEQNRKAEGTGKIPPMPPVAAKSFLRASGGKTGHIARLHVLLTRSSRGTQARLQSQPDRRLPSPGVLAIRSATRHRVTQPLEVARRQRLVDALQPLLIADRLFALPQQGIAAPPTR